MEDIQLLVGNEVRMCCAETECGVGTLPASSQKAQEPAMLACGVWALSGPTKGPRSGATIDRNFTGVILLSLSELVVIFDEIRCTHTSALALRWNSWLSCKANTLS